MRKSRVKKWLTHPIKYDIVKFLSRKETAEKEMKTFQKKLLTKKKTYDILSELPLRGNKIKNLDNKTV
jgi:hypothetical protein